MWVGRGQSQVKSTVKFRAHRQQAGTVRKCYVLFLGADLWKQMCGSEQ